jgi:S1-C subfamily serine protease
VIETFRIKTAESLNALFEAQKKQPANRKLESSYARGDSFFVSGLQGLKQFAVRAQLKKGELRGYTIFYDQAMEGIMLPVLPAMAHAFAPFPEGAAPIAALSRPVAYGTGVIVSDRGHIVTDRRFTEGCDVITIPGIGHAERIATDDAHGLGLLRIYGKRKLKAAALSDAPAPRDVKLTGVADPNTQNGNSGRSTIIAQLTDNNAIRLHDSVPLAGFSGAPALDAQGRVLGIMDMSGIQLASAQPAVPPVRFIPAAAIRSFLSAHHVPPTQGNGGEAAIVRVICVRH